MKNLLCSVSAFVVVGCGGAVTVASEEDARELAPVEEGGSEASEGGEGGGRQAGEERAGFEDPDCPDCVLRCTSVPAAGKLEVVRVFVRPGEDEGSAVVRALRGPLHEETLAGPAAGEPVMLAEGKGFAETERGKFTGEPWMLTAARVELGELELEVHITYS